MRFSRTEAGKPTAIAIVIAQDQRHASAAAVQLREPARLGPKLLLRTNPPSRESWLVRYWTCLVNLAKYGLGCDNVKAHLAKTTRGPMSAETAETITQERQGVFLRCHVSPAVSIHLRLMPLHQKFTMLTIPHMAPHTCGTKYLQCVKSKQLTAFRRAEGGPVFRPHGVP